MSNVERMKAIWKVARGGLAQKRLSESMDQYYSIMEDLVQRYSGSKKSAIAFRRGSRGMELWCWFRETDEADSRENCDILFGGGNYILGALRLEPGTWVGKGPLDVLGAMLATE